MSFHLFGGDRLLRGHASMAGGCCSESLLSDCYDRRSHRNSGQYGGCDGGQCVPSQSYGNLPGYARGFSGYGGGFPGYGGGFPGYGGGFPGYGGGLLSMLGRGHGFGGAFMGGLLGSLAMRLISRGFGGRGFGLLNRGRGGWGGGGGCDNGGYDGGGWQNGGDDSLTLDNIYERTDSERRREQENRRQRDRQPADGGADRAIDALPAVSDGSKQQAKTMTEFEDRTLALINNYRRQNGLQDVSFDPRLQLIALEHSKYQNANGLGHNEIRPGWETPGRRMQQVGLQGWAENAAYGAISTPEQLVRMWINSPGHRRALLLPEARIAGISKYGSGATLDLV